MLACLFYLCLKIESLNTLQQKNGNANVTRFQSDKFIRRRGLSGGKLFTGNEDVMIMGTTFEIPENDGILLKYPSMPHTKSKEFDISEEKWVPLSLLQIKVFYDDGFLDHPDIKTTHDAINYIMATLEHVQHSMCLSTIGTRLQIEVFIYLPICNY